MNIRRSPALLFMATLLITAISGAQEPGDRERVLQMVQQFFDGMEHRDVELSENLLMTDGRYYGYRESDNGTEIISRSHSEHLDLLVSREAVIIERFWDPTVLLHDRMAVVWAPYDLYADGEFVHCGIDSFSFIKTDAGWKITGIVFSMEPEGCADSPLGPLKS